MRFATLQFHSDTGYFRYHSNDRIAEVSKHQRCSTIIVAAAFGAIYHPATDRKGYVSMAISSGQRLLRFMVDNHIREFGAMTADLADKYKQEVVLGNIQEGRDVASRIGTFVDYPLIVPAKFEQSDFGWGFAEYMAMWERAIEGDPTVDTHFLADGYQYSNGSSEEYLLSCQLALGLRGRTNMTILDHLGNPYTLQRGLRDFQSALADFQRHEISQPILAATVRDLLDIVYLFYQTDKVDTSRSNPEFLKSTDWTACWEVYQELDTFIRNYYSQYDAATQLPEWILST